MRVRALEKERQLAARKGMHVAQEIELVPVDVGSRGEHELRREDGERCDCAGDGNEPGQCRDGGPGAGGHRR